MKKKAKDRAVKWLKGLASAAITGGASGVGLILAEPDIFNFGDGFLVLLKVCAINAIIATAAYLKQSPIPNGGTK